MGRQAERAQQVLCRAEPQLGPPASVADVVAGLGVGRAHAVPLGDESVHGVVMEAARSRVVNSWRKAHLKPEHLLAAPRQWASIDYANLEGANVRGEASLTAEP